MVSFLCLEEGRGKLDPLETIQTHFMYVEELAGFFLHHVYDGYRQRL